MSILPNAIIPRLFAPPTLFWILARNNNEVVWHDTRWHRVICPNTPIRKLSRDFQFSRALKDLRANPYHSSDKAGKMLALWLDDYIVSGILSHRPGKKDI